MIPVTRKEEKPKSDKGKIKNTTGKHRSRPRISKGLRFFVQVFLLECPDAIGWPRNPEKVVGRDVTVS